MIVATPRFIRHLAQTKRKDLKASKVTKAATMSNEQYSQFVCPRRGMNGGGRGEKS